MFVYIWTLSGIKFYNSWDLFWSKLEYLEILIFIYFYRYQIDFQAHRVLLGEHKITQNTCLFNSRERYVHCPGAGGLPALQYHRPTPPWDVQIPINSCYTIWPNGIVYWVYEQAEPCVQLFKVNIAHFVLGNHLKERLKNIFLFRKHYGPEW